MASMRHLYSCSKEIPVKEVASNGGICWHSQGKKMVMVVSWRWDLVPSLTSLGHTLTTRKAALPSDPRRRINGLDLAFTHCRTWVLPFPRQACAHAADFSSLPASGRPCPQVRNEACQILRRATGLFPLQLHGETLVWNSQCDLITSAAFLWGGKGEGRLRLLFMNLPLIIAPLCSAELFDLY